MQTVDTIISAEHMLTVDARNTILKHHALIIKNGLIIDIVPSDSIQKYVCDAIHHRDLIIPGFINAHSHAAMSLFRNLACDKSLEIWLQEYIWPAEKALVNKDFVSVGTICAIAEMIKSGITCFNDMYLFADTSAQIAAQVGIRMAVGLIFLEFPSPWANDIDQYTEKALKMHDNYKNHPLIKPIFAPHAPYTISDDTFGEINKYANELNVPIHMHIHETQQEIIDSLDQYGKRPLERLDELGLLGPNLIAVHMVHLNDDEIKQIQNTNTHVVHCPKSNLKLGSGIADVFTLQQSNINVALGTDGASSNNNLNILSEMQLASLLAKGSTKDATAIDAKNALRMATINGAKALGLDEQIGSLEVGKSADVVALDGSNLATLPDYNLFSSLVYSADKSQISDVWVAGKALLADGHLTNINEDDLLQSVQLWQKKITDFMSNK